MKNTACLLALLATACGDGVQDEETKPEPIPVLDWEVVQARTWTYGTMVHRTPVPAGWLVSLWKPGTGASITFVPDREHAWEIEKR